MTLETYKTMLLIRKFEERVQELFNDGVLKGTTHLCIGQESIPATMKAVTNREDIWLSNHRGHGHYIAHTNDVDGLMAELFGKETGICGGRGGSQHLSNGQTFFSNGIVGGMAPIAAGIAFAEKRRKSGKVVVCFLGDGALNQGVVYESFNLVSLWQLPVIYVIEANYYAMSTPESCAHSELILFKFHDLGRVFAINTEMHLGAIINNDKKINALKSKINTIRSRPHPLLLALFTPRLCGHSKSDKMEYIPNEETAWNTKHDVLNMFMQANKKESAKMQDKYEKQINKAVERAQNAKNAVLF